MLGTLLKQMEAESQCSSSLAMLTPWLAAAFHSRAPISFVVIYDIYHLFNYSVDIYRLLIYPPSQCSLRPSLLQVCPSCCSQGRGSATPPHLLCVFSTATRRVTGRWGSSSRTWHRQGSPGHLVTRTSVQPHLGLQVGQGEGAVIQVGHGPRVHPRQLRHAALHTTFYILLTYM